MLCAFHFLEANGEDIRREPIENRIRNAFRGDGAVIYKHVCALGTARADRAAEFDRGKIRALSSARSAMEPVPCFSPSDRPNARPSRP